MDDPGSPLLRFLVEFEGDRGGELMEHATRSRAAARALRATGVQVRVLRAVGVPEDDRWYLLMEAPDATAVTAVADRAGLVPTRVGRALRPPRS